MTERTRPETCEVFRDAIQDRLDGPIDAESAAALEDHLRRCGDCREAASGLGAVRSALRGMPSPPMPEEVRRAILARTVEAAVPDRAGRRAGGRFWSAVAAAAVLLAIVAGVLWSDLRRDPGPSIAETERAEREARYVLSIASAALRRGERAAIHQVLGNEVAPAVRRIPLRWSDESRAESALRRNGT